VFKTSAAKNDLPIPVVFDDGELLIVNKPGGLLTIPGRSPELADCLWQRLRDQFPEREVFLVHRLDRDTAGLIVFALTRDAQAAMGRRFEYRRVRKEYEAWVHGQVAEDEGEIDGPIRKNWQRTDAPVYQICPERGKAALTRFRVLKREEDHTLLRLFPLTGRSHQLRVHLLSLGHPVVGDPIYAPPESPEPLRLCAVSLHFEHPLHKGETVSVSVVPPWPGPNE